MQCSRFHVNNHTTTPLNGNHAIRARALSISAPGPACQTPPCQRSMSDEKERGNIPLFLLAIDMKELNEEELDERLRFEDVQFELGEAVKIKGQSYCDLFVGMRVWHGNDANRGVERCMVGVRQKTHRDQWRIGVLLFT